MDKWMVTERQRESLGLGERTLRHGFELPFASPSTTWRERLEAMDEQALEDLNDGLEPLPCPALERIDLEILQAADDATLLVFRERAARALSYASTGEGCWQEPSRPHQLYLFDLEEGALLHIHHGQRPGCLVRREGGQLQGVLTVAALLSVPRPEPFVPEAPEAWLEGLDDPWLEAQMRPRLLGGDLWGWAVAIGLMARLRQTPPARTRQLLQMFVRGQKDPERERPSAWIRGLSDSLYQQLQDLLTAQLQYMDERLSRVSECEDPVRTRSASLELMLARDDVECVLALLRKRGGVEAVMPGVRAFDQRGRAFLAGLPVYPEWQEVEQLRRTLAAAPESWWTWGGVEQAFVVLEQEIPPQQLKQWLSRTIAWLPARPTFRLLSGSRGLELVAVAAQSEAFDGKSALVSIEFRAEDGSWRAAAEFPAAVHEEDIIGLQVLDPEGLPYPAQALELNGQSWELVAGRIPQLTAKAFYEAWSRSPDAPEIAVFVADQRSPGRLHRMEVSEAPGEDESQ